MGISNNTKELIKLVGKSIILNRFIANEGYRLKSYKDTEGYWTIGIGHKLGKGNNYANVSITSEEAIEIFWDDFDVAVLDSYRYFSDMNTYPYYVQVAVAEMCFVLGHGGFGKFRKTIAYLKNRNYGAAADEIFDSLWFTQAPNRVRSVSNLFLNKW